MTPRNPLLFLAMAEPAYAADTVLGVVALNPRIDTLQHLTRVGSAISDTMMISEANRH